MQIDILTLFPDMFQSFLDASILGRAQQLEIVNINTVNIRDYSKDKHKSIDEPPYGGGGGMVLGPQAVFDAVEDFNSDNAEVILLTPQGRTFSQRVAEELSSNKHLILVCGHYEGVDERIRENVITDEISIGDFVLTGGEIAAVAVIDSVVRLLPGALGNYQSAEHDSFSMGFLEYPHYTRPREFYGCEVPEILLSGDHEKIRIWREKEALRRTLKRRVDLFKNLKLSADQEELMREVIAEEYED